MRHQEHLKQKARSLRSETNLTLDEIALRLNVSKTTVHYWVRDVEFKRAQLTPKQTPGQQAATRAMSEKFARRRQDAYDRAYAQAPDLLLDMQVRDFVILYLAEGYRKDRNVVSLSNSNPTMIRFAHNCIKRLTTNTHIHYSFQFHADQDPEELKSFWATLLGVEFSLIRAIPKTNSGHLKGRNFACAYGVFQVNVGDTLFRSRLQALMDYVQAQWSADTL